MSGICTVAMAEWRAWLRSRLALGAGLLLLALLVTSTGHTALRLQAERAEREHHQGQAEAAFLAQPDRHPHRMVHYGHYVVRTPPPLSVLDPGLDAVTGQSLFLEGHRQNSAMFAARSAEADMGAWAALSPALVWQLFAPLLLVLLGHGALAREREAGTLAMLLAQGVRRRVLLAGKALALLAVVGILLLPLAAGALLAVAGGEEPLAALALLLAYALYGLLWAALALLASALWRRRAAALAALVAVWIALTLVLPSLAVSAAAASAPMPGKLQSDLAMLAELRRLGDGHNANDPAFAQLRTDLLKQHRVERVEDLPVNLRGVVSAYSERKLTDMLNAWAERRMAGEQRQAAALARFGWASPQLALAGASRALAGTDLAHHHRFLRAAEALRYDFVQGLNRVHAEQLAYADDVRRSSDAEAERRTRVAASNWQLLQRFRFEPDTAPARLARAAGPFTALLVGCLLVGVALTRAGRRLNP
jgi:ABC-2 type transport system permease protein